MTNSNNFEKFEKHGIDYKDGVERFMGNEELYIKYLKLFQTDGNYDQFMKHISEKQYDRAKTHLHALKGLCANLSMSSLFSICEEIEEKLEDSSQGVDIKPLAKAYNKINNLVSVLD